MKAEMRERQSGAPAAGHPRSRRGQKHSSLESLEGVWPYRHLGVLVWPGLSDSPAARSRPQMWPRETSSSWSEKKPVASTLSSRRFVLGAQGSRVRGCRAVRLPGPHEEATCPSSRQRPRRQTSE